MALFDGFEDVVVSPMDTAQRETYEHLSDAVEALAAAHARITDAQDDFGLNPDSTTPVLTQLSAAQGDMNMALTALSGALGHLCTPTT